MAEPAVRRTSADGSNKSIGDLVSIAARDVSQLVRYELDLAKLELKEDVKRIAIGGALFVVGGFVACLILIMLCFALAYGLNAAGVWLWLSFIYAAVACVLVTVLALGVGFLLVRKTRGMTKTRRSLADNISFLRDRSHHVKGTPHPDGAKPPARAG
jgi:uncharacterized membrane protein YqjE